MSVSPSAPEGRTPTRLVRMRKILVIDRDPAWGPAIRLALEESGYYLNLVTDPSEGFRREMERAYDLVVVSSSVGAAGVRSVVDGRLRRSNPPAALVLADAAAAPAEKRLIVLRRGCDLKEIVDAAQTLIGVPWTDHKKGA